MGLDVPRRAMTYAAVRASFVPRVAVLVAGSPLVLVFDLPSPHPEHNVARRACIMKIIGSCHACLP